MVGAVAAGNVLVSLDDAAVWTDEGEAYTASFLTNPANFGRTAPAGRLRRIAQAVTLGADATVAITPVADGSEYTDQADSQTLMASDGATQIMVTEPAVEGRRFQYQVEVSAFTGPVLLGEADLHMIQSSTA